MHTLAAAALLPAGFMDVLPPAAAFEAQSVERLVHHFEGFGYDRVKPPLIEFEETMLAGSAAALAAETFRLMDPISQRLLAVRSDMTMQVARIACSRLAHWPRPLRLAYSGQVMRVRGSQLRPERQFGEVGAEIVGSDAPAADVEVMVMAASALEAIGVTGLSVDLGVPTLVRALLAEVPLEPAVAARVRVALDRKDMAELAAMAPALGNATAGRLARLVDTTGPADTGLATLAALDLPASAAQERARLLAVHTRLRQVAPTLTLTLDVVERRGFEYHSGVTFAVFAAGAADELARGGRYVTETGETATGVTVFMDAVLRALPRPRKRERALLPVGTPPEVAARLRADGWIAVAALDETADPVAEATRLGCSHVVVGGALQPAMEG